MIRKKKAAPKYNPAVDAGDARVVKLGKNYIVLNGNNEPLTARYPAESFRFITDGAKSALRVAIRDGKSPSDAIVALAEYKPSTRAAK